MSDDNAYDLLIKQKEVNDFLISSYGQRLACSQVALAVQTDVNYAIAICLKEEPAALDSLICTAYEEPKNHHLITFLEMMHKEVTDLSETSVGHSKFKPWGS